MGLREDLVKLAVEIGPRGAGTHSEGEAARYIRKRFEARGLTTGSQEFFCITTYSYLYMIYLGVAVACGCISYWFPYWVAPIAVVNAVLYCADLETFPLISRILPKRLSRNMIGEIPASDGRIKLVITAHYDTARSSLAFHPRMLSGFKTSFRLMLFCVLAVAGATTANLVVKAVTGGPNLWVWIGTLVVSGYLLFPLFILMHRERSMDYTPGANDNASGVVAMLSLMDKMSEPESLTEGVMFVATGAEEAGTVGMLEFLAAHGERVAESLIINLDNLGSGHLCYIDCEGMLLGHRASPVLLWLSQRVAEGKGFPVWGTGFRSLSTDATPALVRRYSAMSIMAFDDNGLLPDWHWETDTADKVSIENIELARAFVWNIARMMDPP